MEFYFAERCPDKRCQFEPERNYKLTISLPESISPENYPEILFSTDLRNVFEDPKDQLKGLYQLRNLASTLLYLRSHLHVFTTFETYMERIVGTTRVCYIIVFYNVTNPNILSESIKTLLL